jgi:hypothetical protein
LCGAAEQERGDCTSALKWHRQACELIGQLPECYEAADSLEDMAGTLALLGSFAEAARIAGYCARLRERLAHPINPNERSAYDRMLARLRAGLDGRFAAEFSGYQTDSFAGICRVAGRALEKAGSALKNQNNEDTTSLS